ncbi:hypothetical protein GJU42_09400 [Flavobacterium resistens]|uniref:Glycosyltransferase WbsX n=1 Tax=Flavobacterium resistens TaxID=443612 RepID=A0ABW9Q569_9FLAO|nr:hypothetical protein [Flavobacterium resistens]
MFIICGQNLFSQTSQKNNQKIKWGAYYFDGWTGTYPYHITPELTKSFSNRESKWGWITSSQEIMNEQIDLASNSGLSFFSFCWYYNGKEKYKNEPLNRSLSFYINSPNIGKLGYNLLVANHAGFIIGPDDWSTVCAEWINQFKSKAYLKIDGKPLITFFTLNTLVDKFQTEDKVKDAFNQLRRQAIEAGLKGVLIAVALGPNKKDISSAEACGVDILTGYNYHNAGFVSGKGIVPIENLQKKEVDVWNQFSKISSLPYIPVVTLNWDPRPWASTSKGYSDSPYFTGFSENSIYNSVFACKNWLQVNSNSTMKEKIGFIYAWNEYGEGAYLTPTKSSFNPLKGLKKALKN